MEIVKGTSILRERNKRTLISHIRRLRETSRQELVKLMNVSKNTISLIVEELIKDGIVVERGGEEEQQKGRPRIRIALHPDGYRAIGINVTPFEIQYQIINYYGDVLEAQRVDTVGNQAEQIVDQVDRIVAQLIEKHHRLIGIGIAIPGIVDAQNLQVVTSISMQWSTVSFQKLARFAIPIHLQNSVNMGALDAMDRQLFMESEAAFYIRIGHGVGGAFTFKGQLIQGASFTAGEIGHLAIDPTKEKCSCGQIGCLEMLVKHQAIKQQLLAINESVIEQSEMIIFAQEQLENERVQQVMSQAGTNVGKALVSVIHLINPAYIVIDSSYNRSSAFVASCQAVMHAEAIPVTRKAATVLFDTTRSNLGKGAALFAIYHYEQAHELH
ncbi:ROK family protein [Paenibacillus yanchengensis]|uniref:ROK family protein n=1 Tax=Paenibacillus yanchengensis TaxID=2035833 RepID=A0ABW4YI73_9BACL